MCVCGRGAAGRGVLEWELRVVGVLRGALVLGCLQYFGVLRVVGVQCNSKFPSFEDGVRKVFRETSFFSAFPLFSNPFKVQAHCRSDFYAASTYLKYSCSLQLEFAYLARQHLEPLHSRHRPTFSGFLLAF